MATHFSKLIGIIRTATQSPSNPRDREFYFNPETNYLMIYNKEEGKWYAIPFMPV